MIVVSNATPPVAMAKLNRFNLLQDLFKEISISQAVYNETMKAGRNTGGAREAVQTATWVRRVNVRDLLAIDLL